MSATNRHDTQWHPATVLPGQAAGEEAEKHSWAHEIGENRPLFLHPSKKCGTETYHEVPGSQSHIAAVMALLKITHPPSAPTHAPPNISLEDI